MTEKKKDSIIKSKKIWLGFIAIIVLVIFCYIAYQCFNVFYGSREPKVIIEEIDPSERKYPPGIDFDQCYELLNGKEQKTYHKTYKKNSTENDKLMSCKNYISDSEVNSPIIVTRISDMKVARDADKAIRLNNDDVLIIGGDDHDSAELFNYKDKTFTLISKSIKPYYNKYLIDSDPILMQNGNVFFQGAIFDAKTNTFHKPETLEEKKYITFFKNLASQKWLEENKYKLNMVFPNGEALFRKNCSYKKDTASKCSEIYLESPLSNNKYKPAKFISINDRFNNDQFRVIYMAKNSILLIKGEEKANKKGESDYIQSLKIYNPLNGTLKNIDTDLELGCFYSFMKLDNQNILLNESFDRDFDSEHSCFYSGRRISKLNLLNDTVTFLGIIPFSSHTIGMFNKNYLLSKGYGYFSVFNLKTKKFYRTLYPHKGLFSEGFVRLNDNEVLITGGYTGDSPHATYLARSKYAAIITIKQEDKSKNN